MNNLYNIPFPPSENNLTRNLPGRGRVKTKEYTNFVKQMQAWGQINHTALASVIDGIDWDKPVSIMIVLNMHKSDKICKDGTIKRRMNDILNFPKGLIDVLFKMLGKDDSIIWYATIMARIVPDNVEKYVQIDIGNLVRL